MPADSTPGELTDDEQTILNLAGRRWTQPGSMLNAIRELGISSTEFFRRLDLLLDDPRALPAKPTTVARLRRLRDRRGPRR